jgi:hypothetical protein
VAVSDRSELIMLDRVSMRMDSCSVFPRLSGCFLMLSTSFEMPQDIQQPCPVHPISTRAFPLTCTASANSAK